MLSIVTFFQATPVTLGPIGDTPGTGLGPWSDFFSADILKVGGTFSFTISRIIGIMTIVAGIWFIFRFILGAFSYITAGYNQENVKKATDKITNALIGLVVVVAAYAIISLLGALLGFDILQPQEIIKKLGP